MKSILHFIAGVSFPTFGIVVSLSALEQWLRILSLVVGIAVGIVSFASLIKHWRDNKKDK